MSEFLKNYLKNWQNPSSFDPLYLVVALSCALVCGFIIAETYRRTDKGVDYSRPFLQVLLVIAAIVSFVTLIVGDDLARAFTLVGALSVIRFRTAVKEARDLAFIFWAVAIGMGSGSGYITSSLAFSIVISILIFILTALKYGVQEPNLKVLRVRMDSKAKYDTLFIDCFPKFLKNWKRLSVSLVRQGLLYEVVYLIHLQDKAKEEEFIDALRELVGDHPITLSNRDQEAAF
jgi:hypothetical protein